MKRSGNRRARGARVHESVVVRSCTGKLGISVRITLLIKSNHLNFSDRRLNASQSLLSIAFCNSARVVDDRSVAKSLSKNCESFVRRTSGSRLLAAVAANASQCEGFVF